MMKIMFVVPFQTMFIVFHTLKGTPWESGDQGKVRTLTHWEQIDDGAQFTATRKFLTITPVILWVTAYFCFIREFIIIRGRFFLASFYTKYDSFHFAINFCTLIAVTVPKLPQLHEVRVFGINKYWSSFERLQVNYIPSWIMSSFSKRFVMQKQNYSWRSKWGAD